MFLTMTHSRTLGKISRMSARGGLLLFRLQLQHRQGQGLLRFSHSLALSDRHTHIERQIERQRVFSSSLRDIVINHSKQAVSPSASPSPSSDSSLEAEKTLYSTKRLLSEQYSRGDYRAALQSAQSLHAQALQLYSPSKKTEKHREKDRDTDTETDRETDKGNAVVASCLNNIALMHRQLGENEQALDHYIAALQMYEQVSGRKSLSYAATLSNLGAIYKHMAASAKGLEKLQFLDRAEEALGDAYQLRVEMFGKNHRDSLTSKILLASVIKLRNRDDEAINSLKDTLKVVMELFGEHDTLTATVENNLGYMYKTQGEFGLAKSSYEKAVAIRSKTLGEEHPESIIAMHNLAECLLASGNEQDANQIQQRILQLTSAKASDIKTNEVEEKPHLPMSAAMMTFDPTSSIRPKASEIVKKAGFLEEGRPMSPPPTTFKSKPKHTPATRKK